MPTYRHESFRMTITSVAKCMLITLAYAAGITAQQTSGLAVPGDGLWSAFIQGSRRTVHADCSAMESLDWLRDYAEWHAQQLKHPENARFLLYACGPPSWENSGRINASYNLYNCAGMGDRLRGMVEMLRQAAYSRRVLLYHWSHPFSLEHVFDPTYIDWRVKDEYKLNVTDAPFIHHDYGMSLPEGLKHGTWKRKHTESKLVIMRTAQPDNTGTLYPYWPHFGYGSPEERACAYHALFQPNQMLKLKVMETLTRMLGSPTKPYVAVHLRMGGLQGEPNTVERFDQFKGLLSALVCARAFAAAAKCSSQPVVVITDNELLRNMIAARYFRGVTGPPADVMPAHLNAARGASIESHISSFVDIVILSKAVGLLRSPSGFSNIAWYLGQNQYSRSLPECIDVLAKKPDNSSDAWLKQAVTLQAFQAVE